VSDVRLTLLTKPGCHLCDDARQAIQSVLSSDAVVAAEMTVTVDELNILEDDALLTKYAEEIPVLLINNQMHSYWHIDPQRLTKALLES
jgi:glutaredoxin